jgi:arginyl-tRNA synthetase
MPAVAAQATISIVEPEERALALHILRFPESVSLAIDDLAPNRITEYLYELTQIFSSFYDKCQVCCVCVAVTRLAFLWSLSRGYLEVSEGR